MGHMNMEHIYKAALYLRLSKDDTDTDGSIKKESNSIVSQKDLLEAYVKKHNDMEIYGIYTDDGYSGASFGDRPGLQNMLSDIYARKADCVIVKDLSRFGRDYIEAGRFIQKTFPAFNVRFIAVTDNYDSLYADRADSSLVLPVKNFINDSYCRDTSIKVRSCQQARRLEGKCISAFAPYGYIKDPDNKNHLVADKYAAGIVKRIFKWKMEGMSLLAVANRLDSSGILPPAEYKKLAGLKYQSGFKTAKTGKWSAVSVKRILSDRVYTGDMVQGKREKTSYKIKKRIVKPEHEWVCVKNTHEAIISEIDFNIVQELLMYDGRQSAGTDTANFFCGALFCADCGTPMVKRVNKYKGRQKVFYICQTKNQSKGCTRHSIPEETLKDIILKEIVFFMDLMAYYPDVLDFAKRVDIDYKEAAGYNTQAGILTREYNRYYSLKNGLISDLENGLADSEEFEEFKRIYENKCAELENAIKNQKRFAESILHNYILAKARLEKFREAAEIAELTRELLVTMVKKIYVHEGKKVDILFRFANQGQGGGIDGKDKEKIPESRNRLQ